MDIYGAFLIYKINNMKPIYVKHVNPVQGLLNILILLYLTNSKW